MKLGVMSDTHGHLTQMRQAARRMIEEFGVDTIIHLGDDSTDADELLGLGVDVLWVPGLFEDRYKDKNIPHRVIHEFSGVPFLLTHTPTRNVNDRDDDLNPTEAAQDGDAKAVLYGHTHMFSVEERHGAIYINPGHLKPGDKRAEHLSFAILDVSPRRIDVQVIELTGDILEKKTFFVD